jgi:hypothetical protein
MQCRLSAADVASEIDHVSHVEALTFDLLQKAYPFYFFIGQETYVL